MVYTTEFVRAYLMSGNKKESISAKPTKKLEKNWEKKPLSRGLKVRVI